jgi:hypothetical protein
MEKRWEGLKETSFYHLVNLVGTTLTLTLTFTPHVPTTFGHPLVQLVHGLVEGVFQTLHCHPASGESIGRTERDVLTSEDWLTGPVTLQWVQS